MPNEAKPHYFNRRNLREKKQTCHFVNGYLKINEKSFDDEDLSILQIKQGTIPQTEVSLHDDNIFVKFMQFLLQTFSGPTEYFTFHWFPPQNWNRGLLVRNTLNIVGAIGIYPDNGSLFKVLMSQTVPPIATLNGLNSVRFQ